MEANPAFNAGRGSALTADGTVEMEACIMDGSSMNCGAVIGLSNVVHPITLARLVMENTPHIYLAFEGAEAFARQQVSLLFNALNFIHFKHEYSAGFKLFSYSLDSLHITILKENLKP